MPFSFRLNAYLGTVLGYFPCFYVLISKSKPSVFAKRLSNSMACTGQCKIIQEIYFSFISFNVLCLFISKLVRVI